MFYVPRTRFRQYGWRQIHFSYFTLTYSFWTVPRAPCPIFTFCALRLIFGGTEGAGSIFHILRSWTRFRRYRGCQALFSCFVLPDSFSAVPRASGSLFMSCAPELVFSSTEGTCPIFMFCVPGLIFGGTEGARSTFHALPNLFSAVPMALGPLFMRSQTHFGRYRGRRIHFSCASGLIFDDTEGVGSTFNVLRFRTCFRRYRGCQVHDHSGLIQFSPIFSLDFFLKYQSKHINTLNF
jgi:hypothetical protein